MKVKMSKSEYCPAFQKNSAYKNQESAVPGRACCDYYSKWLAFKQTAFEKYF